MAGEDQFLVCRPPLTGVFPVLRSTKVGRRRSHGEWGTRPITPPHREDRDVSRDEGQEPLSSLTLLAILEEGRRQEVQRKVQMLGVLREFDDVLLDKERRKRAQRHCVWRCDWVLSADGHVCWTRSRERGLRVWLGSKR